MKKSSSATRSASTKQASALSLRSRSDGLPEPILNELLRDIEQAGGFTKDLSREPRFKLGNLIKSKSRLYGVDEKRKRQVENKIQKWRLLSIEDYQSVLEKAGIRPSTDRDNSDTSPDSPSSQSSSSSSDQDTLIALESSPARRKTSSLPRSFAKATENMASLLFDDVVEIEVDVFQNRLYPESILGIATPFVHMTRKKGVAKAFDLRLPVLDPNDIGKYSARLAPDGMSISLTIPTAPAYFYMNPDIMADVERDEDKYGQATDMYFDEAMAMTQTFATKLRETPVLQTRTVQLNLNHKCCVFDDRFGSSDGQSKIHGSELTAIQHVLPTKFKKMKWTVIYVMWRVQIDDSFEKTSTPAKKDKLDELAERMKRMMKIHNTSKDPKQKKRSASRKSGGEETTGQLLGEQEALFAEETLKSNAEREQELDLELSDEEDLSYYHRASIRSYKRIDPPSTLDVAASMASNTQDLKEEDDHLRHLLKQQEQAKSGLFTKLEEVQCQDKDVHLKRDQILKSLQQVEHDRIKLEQYSVESTESLRLDQAHLQAVEEQIRVKEQEKMLLERLVTLSNQKKREKAEHLRVLTEDVNALEIKKANKQGELQLLNAQLTDKQGAVLLLEDSVNYNERELHNQKNRVLEQNERLKGLEMQLKQGREKLQQLHAHAAGQQHAVLKLEEKAMLDEYEWNVSSTRFNELRCNRDALEIKQGWISERLRLLQSQLADEQQAILRLESAVDHDMQQFERASNRMLQLEMAPVDDDGLVENSGTLLLMENEAAPDRGNSPDSSVSMETTNFVQDEPRIKSGPVTVKTKVKLKLDRRKPAHRAKNGTRPANVLFVFPKLSPDEPVEEVD
ncbi:hypothetical protein FisN_UnNu086 [Fistulifera solaris]|uniref:Uncharacterized protein n=1 Tax=Fistulifera solaris TaxID=1519565 RepID=A0A1Z5JUY2_FISSO|nr:hypothetical protein FisN_UnNu086 [Fistulifera solaris]|eukprot:GAX17652.1 hypothetical protein FisN_UnNu086 [Fistulifera solaris]